MPLAVLFATSQSALDQIIHHLVPPIAHALTPDPAGHTAARIIDATRSPCTTKQSLPSPRTTAAASTPTSSSAPGRRRVVAIGQCWPGNRNAVVVAHRTHSHLLAGQRVVLGDRAIPTITTPQRDRNRRTIRGHHCRAHRRIKARVEHVITRLKDWQILHQCRRRGDAINHILQIVAGLWNLTTRSQLRVNS